MKTRLWKIILAILLLPVCANATDITFASSGSIVGGNAFDTVIVQNNGTVVNMSGGQIGYNGFGGLYTYNSSIFNMSGGQIGSFILHHGSGFNFSGGTIEADFEFDGNVNISGGSITTENGKFVGTTVITNGDLNFSWLGLYGGLNISGGLLNVDDVYVAGPNPINIFGYSFHYDPVGDILTGYLLDNNPFSIGGLASYEYQYLNLVPEPVSVLLFGFGLLALRKR